MATLRLVGVSKVYGGNLPTIKNVNLEIGAHEFIVFVGPSGCGKSTLLRMIAGLEDITAGELYISNKLVNDVQPAERGVAMVFQSYALYPHMTVYKNMSFGLQIGKVNKEAIETRVREAAKMLQLENLLDRLPKELSGGQRQRVAIGRAIVRDPDVFLFDEPLSNLDAALRLATRLEIAKLHKKIPHTSTIYVTHDQVEAMTLADKIVLLHAGEAVQTHGSVAQYGTPAELYHFPTSKFVAGFIGSPAMNFLDSTPKDSHDELSSFDIKGSNPVHGRVSLAGVSMKQGTLGIRPEHIQIVSKPTKNSHETSVTHHENLGELTYLYVTLGEQNLIVKQQGSFMGKVGDKLYIILPEDRIHFFDASGQAAKLLVKLEEQ